MDFEPWHHCHGLVPLKGKKLTKISDGSNNNRIKVFSLISIHLFSFNVAISDHKRFVYFKDGLCLFLARSASRSGINRAKFGRDYQ